MPAEVNASHVAPIAVPAGTRHQYRDDGGPKPLAIRLCCVEFRKQEQNPTIRKSGPAITQ